MKKLLIIALLLLLSYATSAQENSQNSFGLIAGIGKANIIRTSLEGGPSLELQNNFEFGPTYYRQLGNHLRFETGLIYHYNTLIQRSAVGIDHPPTNTRYDVHLLYLPAFLRFNLSKHFFINGGALLDIDVSNSMGLSSSRALSSQSGAGAGFGIGGEFPVLPNLLLQINPYLNLHGALPLTQENYPGRILDTGIRLGIRTR